MKFQFLNGLDSPDWLLAGISLLNKITVIKIRLLAKEVVNALKASDGAEIHPDMQRIQQLVQDGNDQFDLADVQLVFATELTILRNAARNNVPCDVLDGELQQLGLPAEHSTGICKIYDQNREELVTLFTQRFFRFGKLTACNWRMDRYIASSTPVKPGIVDQSVPGVSLNLRIKGACNRIDCDEAPEAAESGARNERTETMYLNRATLNMLIQELSLALRSMDNVNSSKGS